MSGEKSIKQLEKENEELRDILTKVVQAYDILNDELKDYKEKNGVDPKNAKVSNPTDVKKLLEKYSRL